jgi:NTE family protein
MHTPDATLPLAGLADTAPQLALVIGSGGVKSIAGVGVARALAERGHRPDLIVGCSAGAIFGALIARGDSPAEAQAIATSLWTRELTSRHRVRSWIELGAPALAGFDESFALRDDSLVRERIHRVFGEQRIEELPTAFAVVATHAASGERVVLRHGRIVDALRATVALPFLFAPWEVEGQLLMDGSICDPLPVAVAAAAVRTVAVGFRCPMPSRVNRPGRLATRMIAALTNNVMQAHLAAADPVRCHVMLLDPSSRVGLFDTHRMPELVELGHRRALDWLDAPQAPRMPVPPTLAWAAAA